MVGWHHRLGGHEFEQAVGVGDGQSTEVQSQTYRTTEQQQQQHPSDLHSGVILL